MDKTDALNIVQKYAETVKRKFDCQKLSFSARMLKVTKAKTAILILP